MKRWNLALKKSPRVLSVLLSVTMSMSLFGSFAQAVSAAENTGEETQVLTESEKAELSQKGKESHSSDSGGGRQRQIDPGLRPGLLRGHLRRGTLFQYRYDQLPLHPDGQRCPDQHGLCDLCPAFLPDDL